MMRNFLCFTMVVLMSVVAAVSSFAPAAMADPPMYVVDQVQAGLAGPSTPTLAIGTSSEQRLAQTVVAGVSGRLHEVLLPVGCADGTLIIEITDVDPGGAPGTTVLSLGRYPASRIPSEI